MIIGIVIGSTFVVCLAIIGAVCYMRRRGKVINNAGVIELPHETESNQGPETHKTETIDNPSMLDFKNKKEEVF